jgi:two-component system, chemotaxis family, sensor kinase CheA
MFEKVQLPGGKYREIILAVALFLLLDLSVLILNFYISFQISEDALAINLAGRQRMLSQRITKSLLIAQTGIIQGRDFSVALTELKNTTTLFNKTLHAFEQGGTVPGSDGKLVPLPAVTLPAGILALSQARQIWNPFFMQAEPLLSQAISADTPQQIDSLASFALANNLKLLDLMNQLTTVLEQSASAKADTLRQIQTGGIFLALLNFIFILFKFIRRLRETDRKIEIAQKENEEILSTVKEGLFLLDREFRIGSQHSRSLEIMLGVPIIPGTNFREILRASLNPQTCQNACEYIELLFSEHIKENLMGNLNPLHKVEMRMRNLQGQAVTRYLSIEFNRVTENRKTVHLLVTLFDMTNEVELEKELIDTREEAKTEVEGLLNLLKIDPIMLGNFIEKAEIDLMEMNDELRSRGGQHDLKPLDYRRTVDAIFRKVHTFKGDAAMLGLNMFETLAQKFEAILYPLRNKTTLSGEDLLTLPFYIEEILQRIVTVKAMVDRLSAYHDAFAPALTADNLGASLDRLAQRIAMEQGKRIKVISDLQQLQRLPAAAQTELREIMVQLLRNAVVHGIESHEERVKLGKHAIGNIHVSLHETGNGTFEFTLLDDGRGLSPDRIREALLQSGKYTPAELAEFSERQILMKIFEPGFTTSTSADRHSGHGVGLDVVHKKIEQIGARLRINTQENSHTRFSIIFPA